MTLARGPLALKWARAAPGFQEGPWLAGRCATGLLGQFGRLLSSATVASNAGRERGPRQRASNLNVRCRAQLVGPLLRLSRDSARVCTS